MLLLRTEAEEIRWTILQQDPVTQASVITALAGRFCDRAKPLCRLEARVYDEIIELLAKSQPSPLRARLSRRLATVAAGPERTVRSLCHDPEAEVAAPVLRLSRLLAEDDLVGVARRRGELHLMAIAEREAVAERVTDILVERGTWPVLRAVSANPGAKFARGSLARLAAAAVGDGAITLSLLRRQDVPPDLSQKLVDVFRTLAGSGRLEQKGERSGISLESIRAVEARAATRPPPLPDRPELAAAEARVAALGRHGSLAGEDVSWCIDQDRFLDAAVAIALLAGEPAEVVLRAFEAAADGSEALPAMRLAGLSWPVAAKVIRHRAPALGEAELAATGAAYDALTREAAAKAWRTTKFRLTVTVIGRG